MRFKSQSFTQLSGSLAGTTAAHDRTGGVLRSRARGVNPRSQRQSFARTRFAYLNNLWAESLTPQQHAAWAVFAAHLPTTNALGDRTPLSGLQAFIRSNVPRLTADLLPVLDAPTDFTLSETDSSARLEFFSSSSSIVFFGRPDRPWQVVSGAYLSLALDGPHAATVNKTAGHFNFICAIAGDPLYPPGFFKILPVIFPCVTGQKYFVRFQILYPDGRSSAPWQKTSIVSASP